MEKLTVKNVFIKENIDKALEYILSRKNSCGIDGIYIKDFEEYWNINGEKIIVQILQGTYKSSPVQLRECVMPTGKRRKLAMYTCTDRLIMRILADAIQEKVDLILSDYSFAYRKNKGAAAAAEYACACIQEGKEWVLEIDVEDYFENINLEILIENLQNELGNRQFADLIRQYLYCEVMENDKFSCYIKTKGLVQGSSLSPVLSNLYLNKLDKELEKANLAFCRFGDNINIYFDSRIDAVRWYAFVQKSLEDNFALGVNKNKSGVYIALNRIFLGYSFQKQQNGTVLAFRKAKRKTDIYSAWKTSALQYTDHEYHIINDGILTRKDYTLLFENENGKRFLPAETTNKLNIYSDVIFTSGFFEYAAKCNIDVAIFNKYGKFCGVFYGNRHAATSNMIVKQISFYNDEKRRLSVAKSIITAAAHNMRSNIRYYYKKGKTEQKDISEISEFIKRMNEAVSVQQLMLIEAQCRKCYYSFMGKIINNTEFNFTQRKKKPPTDEVNAMISFGNVYLYEKIATEINKTSLDIKVGFLHATNERASSLNLDIAEIFKPLIVDRTIFTVIHKKIFNKSEHFEPYGENGVYLNSEGKKRYISELRKKLYSRITIKQESVTYNTLIRNEIWKIQRLVENGERYKPYKYSS